MVSECVEWWQRYEQRWLPVLPLPIAALPCRRSRVGDV